MAVTRFLARPGVDLALKLVAVASLLLATWATYGQWQQTGCQARYNEAANRATTARAAAAQEDREAQDADWVALDALIASIGTADTAEEYRAALAKYDETRAETDEKRRRTERARKQNPLPPPPSETCG